jgi:serine/threonine protein phosphatase 1
VNNNLAIIGDVHGESDQLAALLARLEGRRLVFLGDYVNRGPNSRGTLDILLGVQNSDPSSVFLIGNHDLALLEFLSGRRAFHEFAMLGGISTIRSYLSRAMRDVRLELLAKFPLEHHRFLVGCQTFFEEPDLIVSHCGINPSNVGSRSVMDMVTGYHKEMFSDEFQPSKLVVCGHHAQASGVPYARGNVVCLDTGCGTASGPLTALLIPERTFIQE